MASLSEAWEAVKHAIEAYTGLSPATFFTVVAVAAAVYYAVAGFFAPPPPPPRRREVEAPPPPVEIGEITEHELRAFDGSDEKKPLLMAIKGQIYDVTRSRVFYGPGGPYALFAGRDASRALAKMSFEEQDLTGDISGLGPSELEALQDWEYQFMGKYVKVGTVKVTVPVTDGSDDSTLEKTERAAEPTETADNQASDVPAEENGVSPSDLGAKAEHSEDPEVAEHVTESKEAGEGKSSED